MKYRPSVCIIAFMLAAHTAVNINAQNTEPADSLKMFPVQITLAYPLSTHGAQTVDYRYALSLNMLAGSVGAVQGIELAGLMNYTERRVHGVQLAGLANITGALRGMQAAGLANITGALRGMQAAGLANIADSANGIQLAGVSNISGNATAAQIAGIANISENISGTQVAGTVNISDTASGIRVAGIANVSSRVKGTDIAGVFNGTGTLNGFQLALVNVADTIESGISIGLINIIRRGGYEDFSLTFADYQNVGINYRLGTRNFHTTFSIGINLYGKLFNRGDNLFVSGIGFGHRRSISSRVDIHPEIMHYSYFPARFNHNRADTGEHAGGTQATHLRLGFIYGVSPRIGISITPSLCYLQAGRDRQGNRLHVSELNGVTVYDSDSGYHSIGAGISIGIVFNVK